MRRILLPLLSAGLLLTVPPADAWLAGKGGGAPAVTTSQLLLSSSVGNLPSGAADNFLAVGYGAVPASSDSNYSVFGAPGNITKIRARTVGAPTGVQTWTVTLRKNGSDTGLSCAINSSSSQKCSNSSTVSFAAGDYASLKITPSGTPSITRISIALVFAPTTANDTVLFAQGPGLSNSITASVNVGGNANVGAVATRRWNTFPDGGTIDKFYINSNAPGAGTSYAYTVDKNGSTTALTASIADTATSNSDTSHSVSVTGASGTTAGDDILFQSVPASSPASATAAFGARYVPTTAGRFPLISTTGTADNTTSTFYYDVTGSGSTGSATEANNQNFSASMTIERIAVKLTAAPGAGKSRTFTLRKNEADTSCTVTISNTDTAGTASCSVTVADDDRLGTSDAPTNTPAAQQPGISYLATR